MKVQLLIQLLYLSKSENITGSEMYPNMKAKTSFPGDISASYFV